MVPERKLACMLLLMLPLLLTGGCAALHLDIGQERGAYRESELQLVSARDFLQRGHESEARQGFEALVSGAPFPGISDEALFRAALLNLKDENGKGELRARALLEKLLTEYPSSIWSRQAAPLVSHLQEIAALRARLQELKLLRSQNLSLSRDNKELRQSLEKIKNLDLELEQKIRR